MSCAGASWNRVDGIFTRSASTLVWSSNCRSTWFMIAVFSAASNIRVLLGVGRQRFEAAPVCFEAPHGHHDNLDDQQRDHQADHAGHAVALEQPQHDER